MLVDTHGLDVQSNGGRFAQLAVGEPASGDVVCAACGYGIGPRKALPTCPMCRGLVWEQRRPPRLAAGRHPSR